MTSFSLGLAMLGISKKEFFILLGLYIILRPFALILSIPIWLHNAIIKDFVHTAFRYREFRDKSAKERKR